MKPQLGPVEDHKKRPDTFSSSFLPKGLKTNADGSVDVFFGPVAPTGFESNWVQTIPGKSWFMILRLYGPLEPWFDRTWRPGEIELVKSWGGNRSGRISSWCVASASFWAVPIRARRADFCFRRPDFLPR